ncbi:helix-turn-helix domain-containing protein [Planomonospora sp. ID91781]|uniref:helix-turn-helix domain-containing protein n=1 Tax=Planomonospora sp. ID91781 TaxID=2738135 RepID=UPI0018C3E4B1|nr:helix-turn-helix domain-containing protein [Planomonospora sp. ID91781]MBG0825224.1 helix-turn-helix domain-containing protein [Planomonospora sp. ID91781]
MTVTADALMPDPEESGALEKVTRTLHRQGNPRLRLVRGDSETELPPSLESALVRIAELMSAGRGVAIVPVDRELTTREAADLLGVSRPTLIKLLDDGQIGFTRPNNSRRIPLHEVLDYKERRSRRRKALLDEMTADAVDTGLYGVPSSDAG